MSTLTTIIQRSLGSPCHGNQRRKRNNTACEMGFQTLPSWSALRPFNQSFLFFPSIPSLKADIITCLLIPQLFFFLLPAALWCRQKYSCILWDSKGSSQLLWIFKNIFLEAVLLALKHPLIHCPYHPLLSKFYNVGFKYFWMFLKIFYWSIVDLQSYVSF